jgi:Zn-dependent M16 (insulinase) family peptidase
MAYSSVDGRRVFLAYRTVFTGPHAQIRKSKKVREVIEQHKESFKSLIRDFGFEKVADIVKTLLDQRVFESELKAKIAFPELFQTSPARDVQRNASENDAARSVAEALEELTSTSERGGLGDDHEDDNVPESKLPHILHITTRVDPDYLN